MVKLNVVYEGELHTVVTHEATSQLLHTDAPKDNEGKGETFSPTDLLAASLASCIATVLGIYAKKKGWDLRGMKIEVEKTMTSQPIRKIAKLSLNIKVPISLSQTDQEKFIQIAKSCPVHHSLHPEIVVTTDFVWKT